jgi:hypothetical protein
LETHGYNSTNIPQAAERRAGLQLLEVTFQHCSSRTFLQDFPAWSTHLLTLTRKHKEDDQVSLMQSVQALPIRFKRLKRM